MRKSIQIGFDGVPYVIACDIKGKFLQCPKRNVEIDEANDTNLTFHLSKKDGVTTDKSCLRGDEAFKDVLLVPRAGHMEKNLLAIFSLSGNMLLEYLADLLGFRTKKSLEFVMNCGTTS